MKLEAYIEECKRRGWDSEAEHEWIGLQEARKLLTGLAPLIDKRINELKIKVDLGMANSIDEIEYNKYKELFPNTLGDKIK